MKLISVQSRGNRLVSVSEDKNIGAGNWLLRYKQFDYCKGRYVAIDLQWFMLLQTALDMAAEWLEGATV